VGRKLKRMLRDQAWHEAASANPAGADFVAYAYLGCFISLAISVALCLVWGCVVLLLIPATSPADSPPGVPSSSSPQQNVTVVGSQSGRCIDVPNSSTTNGTQVQLWDCHGQTDQRWTYTANKQLMVYGNKCLDANGRGTTDGTTAIIWDCNGQNNQQWNLNANGTISGVQSGLCLDADAQGTANGTKIQLWSCTGAANQKWSLRS
jgi:hypothetical protein